MSSPVIRITLVALLLTACGSGGARAEVTGTSAFKDYWFSGKAEIARYALKQARYGEYREGDAVLIFVMEDSLPDKQVKPDNPDRTVTGAIPVLKLNYVKKFVTGVYPYSMMTSVFTPWQVEAHPRSVKASASIQEWCGQTYAQFNLEDGKPPQYRVLGRSYFESEGDVDYRVEAVPLEDGLFNRIRIAPDELPTGELELIPSLFWARLKHEELHPSATVATLTHSGDEMIYTLEYPTHNRSIVIRFEAAHPYGILGWTETYESRGKTMTTSAERTHVQRLDYWNRNGTEDRGLRDSLGLE